MSTAIEWTDVTWNPVVGCSRVSPGCDNCYAIRVAAREMQPAHVGLTKREDRRRPGGEPDSARVGQDTRPAGEPNPLPTSPLNWTGEVRLLPERLDEPLRWRKPRRCFVCSMSDLFHPDVPDEFIAEVFQTMAYAEQHTFQVLTKRPQRMAGLLGDEDWTDDRVAMPEGCTRDPWPFPNVWLGTSVENQRYAARTRFSETCRAVSAACGDGGVDVVLCLPSPPRLPRYI